MRLKENIPLVVRKNEYKPLSNLRSEVGIRAAAKKVVKAGNFKKNTNMLERGVEVLVVGPLLEKLFFCYISCYWYRVHGRELHYVKISELPFDPFRKGSATKIVSIYRSEHLIKE